METRSLTRVYDTGKATDVVKLAPSILAADFARLGEQVAEAEQAGADRIHVDVMDGHFVPNISLGVPIVASLRRVTRLPLEIHLMISDPDFFLDEFTEAGSDSFLVHWEGNHNLHRTVQRVKTLGKRVGVVINPAIPAAVLEEILQEAAASSRRVNLNKYMTAWNKVSPFGKGGLRGISDVTLGTSESENLP